MLDIQQKALDEANSQEVSPYMNSPSDPLITQQDLLTAIINKQPLYDYSKSAGDNMPLAGSNPAVGSPLGLNLPDMSVSDQTTGDVVPNSTDMSDLVEDAEPPEVTSDPVTLTKQYAKQQSKVPFTDVPDLATMQQDARHNAGLVSMLEGLTDAGRSVATAGRVNEPLTKYDDLRNLAAQPIKDREALLKDNEDKAKRDPNSELSQMQRETVVDMMNKMGRRQLADNIMAKNLSAKQLEDAFGQVGITSMLTHHEASETRKAIAEQNALMRQSMLREAQAKEQDRSAQKVQSLLESARGQPDVSQALKDKYAISKANDLSNRYSDPNKMTNQEVNLLVSELGKVATGGVPNHTELQGLTPDTLKTKFGSIVSKLTSNPTPANAGSFVKMYKNYLNDIGNSANQILEKKVTRILETNKKHIGEENYNNFKEQYGPMVPIVQKQVDSGVRMKSPDGTIHLIPKDQVKDAQASGGVVINE